jgi:hypothetical protein
MGFTHYWSYLPESEQWQAAFPGCSPTPGSSSTT